MLEFEGYMMCCVSELNLNASVSTPPCSILGLDQLYIKTAVKIAVLTTEVSEGSGSSMASGGHVHYFHTESRITRGSLRHRLYGFNLVI